MKYDKIVILDEVFVTQMNHWSLFPVFLTVQGLLQGYTHAQKPDLLMWICCALLPVLFFAVREKMNKFSLFFLLHLLIAGLPFLFPAQNIVSRVLGAACGVCYLIYSLYQYFSPETSGYDVEFPPIFSVCLSAAALLLQHYGSTVPWDFYYAAALVLVLGIYFMESFFSKYIGFLSVSATSSGYVPEKEMFRSGAGIACAYTVGSVLLLLLSANLKWLSVPTEVIRNFIRALLRFLFGLFHVEEDITPGPETVIFNENDPWLPPAGETFWLWDVLAAITFIAFYVLLIYFLGRAVYRLILFLKNRFAQKRTNEIPQDELAVFDVREKCDMINPAGVLFAESNERSFFSALTPRERVRRLFKKYILTAKKHFYSSEDTDRFAFYTARECIDILSENKALAANKQTSFAKKTATSMIAEIYEKARYSEEDISSADVKELKTLLNKN